ncbi:hypothetical protein FKP32DRAFT_1669077 [Trametes sanguinea]|nr:hypothetical protein FKP32DRAFT_1669077 [Trametes sanguinea]
MKAKDSHDPPSGRYRDVVPSKATTTTPPTRASSRSHSRSRHRRSSALLAGTVDALFLRNQTRTAQTWRRINKLAEEKESKKRKSCGSDSSDSEREAGRPDKQGDLPDWTRKRPGELIISSDDSDDDILTAKKAAKSAVVEIPDSPTQSGRRHRTRSRSLTPPPALPQYAIARAQEAIRVIVGEVGRSASPTFDVVDDSVDTIVLDPELASIAKRVKAEVGRQGGTPVPEGGGPEIVTLKIIWKPHPLNPNGRPEVWAMKQRRHENFHRLCSEIADLASVRSENVVLSLDGKRVFPSSTPHSVGVWAEAELEACDKITYQYLQETKRMRSESVAPPTNPHLNDISRRSPSRARSPSITELSESGSGAAESGPEDKGTNTGEAFSLILVSERTKGKRITLRVLPTTKCGVIVRKFLEKAGLQDEYPDVTPAANGRGRTKAAAKAPALSVDGDKMDPEAPIGEADLEDGDQVEVVGL